MSRALTLLRETLAGKDLNRTLCNIATARYAARGRVLDAGGHGGSSYWRFLKREESEILSMDIMASHKPDIVLDLEKEEIPKQDGYFDTILFFNVLEHVSDPEAVLKKLKRVLKNEGSLIGVIPFLVNVHPDPHDYQRFTDEGLERLFRRVGFNDVRLEVIGTGPFGAGYSQWEFMVPRFLKIFLLPITLGLDTLVCKLRPAFRAKYPLSYLFEVRP